VPRSLVEGKAWISHEIARLRPTSILDVGPGQGTYSELLREATPRAHWSCVAITDIRDFTWPQRYDVVILGDVLEHLVLSDALDVWAKARTHADHVALSLPIVEYPQAAQNGNEHEAHLQVWSHRMVLDELPGVKRWHTDGPIGVYLAAGQQES
jgi:hypothetical protein